MVSEPTFLPVLVVLALDEDAVAVVEGDDDVDAAVGGAAGGSRGQTAGVLGRGR
jgi:hypothetical protein